VTSVNRPMGGRSSSRITQSDSTTARLLNPKADNPANAGGRRMESNLADNGPLPRFFLASIVIVTVGGFLLRLPSFHDSLFGDEISTYFIVVGNGLGRVLRIVESNQETSPPLYFIVAWLTKGLFSSPAESIRLISLITGTAAIPLTFLLGLWTVGRRSALVGAVCMAFSPYMIFYSSEARPFMLMMFFVLLSTLALLRALRTGRFGWWVGYAVFTCAAMYTHYTAVFLLVVQLAWAFLTYRQARRALIVSNVAAVLGFLPWINGFREDLHAPNFISALAPVNFHDLQTIVETSWIGHPETAIGRLPGEFTVAIAGAGLLVALIGLTLRARATGGSWWRLPRQKTLIVLLAVAPCVLVALYSWLRTDIFGGPFLIASWPGLALAIGGLVTSPRKFLRLAAVALTIGAFAVGGFKMLGSTAQRPNVDAVVAYINHVGRKGDPIVCLGFFANPLSECDVALADSGQREDHPVIRLGSPTRALQVSHLSGDDPQPVFFGLPVTPPQDVAAQAVALAKHGTIFFVSYSTSLVPNNADVQSAQFLKALPPSFHIVKHLTFSGYAGGFLQNLDVIRNSSLHQ